VLSRVKLIGEPWDIGPGGYQVGGFPPGWAEWNGKYRDEIRDDWRGTPGLSRELATRFTGSGDIYDLRGRRPWSSVNFITAHDGFTLNDLVSYNERHNEANGEDNKDGSEDNRSFNFGVEGPTDDEGIKAARERQKRNLLATLLLSHGAPMILAGDEFGRSQDGNNNAYAQDSEISWVHWDRIDAAGNALTDFVRETLKLREAQPLLRRESFRDGMKIEWLNASGGLQSDEAWNDAGALAIGARLAREDLGGEDWKEVLILFNAADAHVPFALPEREGGWTVALDTAHGDRDDSEALGTAEDGKPEANLFPRSMMLLH
jgi:glycogen operon protein